MMTKPLQYRAAVPQATLAGQAAILDDCKMGELSIWHWIVVIAVVLLLFGRGKISGLMGDVAEGIKAFRKGMSEDEPATQHIAAGKGRDRARQRICSGVISSVIGNFKKPGATTGIKV